MKHSTRIVKDCLDMLDRLEGDEFLVDSLGEALAAYRSGHHRSAQALAASVIDTILRGLLPGEKYRFYGKIKSGLPDRDTWKGLSVRAARTVPTAVALLPLLDIYNPGDGDPVPIRLNRHAAAHSVHQNQYSEVNSIKALMLATSMLCELEYDGWARVFNVALPKGVVQ